ncbi:MAG: FecR family protein, partial [Campylobacterota bacterium]|nr:FecR family protein [Campylobacterota bacterium]
MIKILLFLFLSVTLWANIGNVMAMKGSAELKRLDETLGLKIGMELLEGDSIVTRAKSRVQVMLKDETIVTIGADSSFDFEEFKFDNSKDSKLLMRANRGFFRSVTGKIGEIAPQRFKVKTVSATIGIRGTDFSGNILESTEVIKCYAGVIFVEFDGGLIDIDAGMMIELAPDKAPKVKGIKQEKTVKNAEKKDKTKEKEKEDKESDNKDSSHKDNFEKIVESEIEIVEIPSEDIADVTQKINVVEPVVVEPEPVVEEPEPVVEEPEPVVVEPEPIVVEPFEITPSSEDREVKY